MNSYSGGRGWELKQPFPHAFRVPVKSADHSCGSKHAADTSAVSTPRWLGTLRCGDSVFTVVRGRPQLQTDRPIFETLHAQRIHVLIAAAVVHRKTARTV